jgi:Xaa-Pro aminopeptidase
MMNNVINQRITTLRELMKREKLSAFIFPSTDPHNGEYVPAHWERRKWISGFDGSAGIAVVTMDKAALWTDSRYFIAAKRQLSGTEYVLMKEKIPGTPTISEWLSINLAHLDGPEIGIDGMVSSANTIENLIYEMRRGGGITVRTNLDPLQQIWKDRPAIPDNKIFIHPLQYAGESCIDKIGRIRTELRRCHADGMLISALDDIAWTLNLRGSDIHCSPVFVAYLLIEGEKNTLYINRDKLTDETDRYLKSQNIRIDDYSNIAEGLRKYGEYNILLDPNETSYSLYKSVSCPEIVRACSPVSSMKTIKNDVEIKGYHHAMLRDGVAMVKFLKWLKPAVEKGGQTEITIDEKLTSLRAEQDKYVELSFDTIAAYKEHGAIVHYEAKPDTDVMLKPEGMLLLDSGAQYLDGTTDITRTISLGKTTDKEKHVYTLVLKGHIQVELCKFPSGVSGTQLDVLAKKDMWREGLSYLHGTGHGVGSFLNVHEGPHQIRMEWKPAPLVKGMTVTDEPGIYIEGEFGARTENTLIIKEYMDTEFGQFLQFEPLTLCPIDKELILVDMLAAEERQWLNDYHAKVYEQLSPYLDVDEKSWLREATLPI